MTPNELVDDIVAKITAEDTYGAMQSLLVLRTDTTGLDDPHKCLLADAILDPIWLTNPPQAPVPDPDPDA